MTRKFWTTNLKQVAGILVPIFLSILVPQFGITHRANEIPAVFAFNSSANVSEVFADFGLEASQIFSGTYKADVDLETFLTMRHDSRFAYVEKDAPVSVAAIIPSDPFFTTDSGLADKQWYLAKTHVPDAWEFTRGSPAVTVAIIDTGIHASHVELNDGRIVEGYNVITKQLIPANSDSDDNGHGTAVAGVIGAASNNIRGMAGINWNIKIMPIKALAADGTGDLSAVAAGVVWAADHGANIINLSLGGPGYGADMTMSNAIGYAFGRGVLIVSAAGNDLADQGLN
ncbi:MAG: S8 family serine peptidase, partial [bacterium]|nr:S8 family serine peptidase [bacterium]